MQRFRTLTGTLFCAARTACSATCALAILTAGSAGCSGLPYGAVLGDLLALAPGAQTGEQTNDEQTIRAGLEEALRVGTERTVKRTSRPGGFLEDAVLRILLPESLQKMGDRLRQLGLGRQVDELEIGMNRAAERACGEAKPIFWNALSQMTWQDAYGIWRGGQTAATDYFRERTSEALRARMGPIVRKKMDDVGLYRLYQEAVSSYARLPLVQKPRLDLGDYVTDRTLEGLFHVLAAEEQRIRQDPAARTTELLRRVFGRLR